MHQLCRVQGSVLAHFVMFAIFLFRVFLSCSPLYQIIGVFVVLVFARSQCLSLRQLNNNDFQWKHSLLEDLGCSSVIISDSKWNLVISLACVFALSLSARGLGLDASVFWARLGLARRLARKQTFLFRGTPQSDRL